MVPVKDAQGLLVFKHLALADPEGAPAGVYARTWLEAERVWDRVKDLFLPAMDVRGAVGLVNRGDADAAVVFQSDARAAPELRVVYRVPLEKTPSVRYAVARLTHAKGTAAEGFLHFLEGDRAKAVFARAGFSNIGAR